MLPFLKPKRISSLITTQRGPSGSLSEKAVEEQDEDLNPGLIACAHDIIAAISSKDSKALAMALKAAFEICDSEPHVEGDHINSYDEMNAKAAEGLE